jgi:hypothetical protein
MRSVTASETGGTTAVESRNVTADDERPAALAESRNDEC